ncbi:MAG: hypothetical protein HYT77_02995 [Deltaproteobacteria bacterium]|nr:hypothetical protein [Deltaproteobacteria bacterium]
MNKIKRMGSVAAWGILFFGLLHVNAAFEFQSAEALAQWARKYNVNCQTCHTAFPRLNYFGEKFKRNGYQMPGSRDGDETKQNVGNLWYDKLGHFLGIRTNVNAIRYEANALTNNTRPRLSVGNPNWIQFFTGGSIFKDASVFVETEILPTEAEINWFSLGYHNLFDSSLLNVRVGRISPMENLGQSGRLRMIPNIRIETISGIASSGGAAAPEDSVPLASAQSSLETYGYQGPFLYSLGVTNGAQLTDVNKFKNFFGTLRWEKEDGALAGSNIGTWGYLGWDTTAANTQSNRFWRTAGSANLRYEKWDVIGLFIYGKDDNWNLSTGLDQTSKGASGQVGYLLTERWFPALQYDWVDGTDGSDNFNRVSPAITFMPRENMRFDLIGRFDLRDTAGGRRHEGQINIRSMF